MTRGKLIAFEGTDRSGKSTQANHLANALNSLGKRARVISFPNRDTAIGRILDDALRGETHQDPRSLHLLFSANRWEMRDTILDLLEAGIHVILDRYIMSGIIFSHVVHDLPWEWCVSTDRGLPDPDLTIFLDIHPTKTAKRTDFGNEIYEDVATQKLVYYEFRNQATQPHWVVIDGDRSMFEVQSSIFDAVRVQCVFVHELL